MGPVDAETPEGQDADGGAVPGWYPDPRGSGNLFYWDGSRWTGDVHSPPSGSSTRLGGLGRNRLLVIAGGVALALSPFMTWVKVILLGDLSLFQLFDAADRGNGWAWAAVVAGIAAAVVALRQENPSAVRGTALAVGLLGGALAIYALADLRQELRDAHGLAQIGIGPYVAISGCVAMVAGGWMAGERRSLGQPPDRASG